MKEARFEPKPSQVGEKDKTKKKKVEKKNCVRSGIEPTARKLQILHITC